MLVNKTKLEPTRYQLFETACSQYHFDKYNKSQNEVIVQLKDIKKILNIIIKKEY